MSPRGDILRGWSRWKWLSKQRRCGRLIEPSLRVQGFLSDLDRRLLIGPACQIDAHCIIWLGAASGKIIIGKNSYIGPFSFLGSFDHALQIGDNTMIGANCYIITENHRTTKRNIPYRKQGFTGSDVTIGSNVWVGCHVSILPGVSIGDGAIIGAGAVVTRNIPAWQTWAGVPARCIKDSLTNQMTDQQ